MEKKTIKYIKKKKIIRFYIYIRTVDFFFYDGGTAGIATPPLSSLLTRATCTVALVYGRDTYAESQSRVFFSGYRAIALFVICQTKIILKHILYIRTRECRCGDI